MPLVSGAEVVLAAAKAGRGVGAFNVIQLEHATALIAGAEQAGAPVILQISENAVKYHGALKPIGVATLAAAPRPRRCRWSSTLTMRCDATWSPRRCRSGSPR